jgi:hypothetical protein
LLTAVGLVTVQPINSQGASQIEAKEDIRGSMSFTVFRNVSEESIKNAGRSSIVGKITVGVESPPAEIMAIKD